MGISSPKKRMCLARDNHKCLRCNTTENLTLDHVIPKVRGGRDWIQNIQTLCRKCNFAKGTKVIQYSKYQKTTKMVNRFKTTGIISKKGR